MFHLAMLLLLSPAFASSGAAVQGVKHSLRFSALLHGLVELGLLFGGEVFRHC